MITKSFFTSKAEANSKMMCSCLFDNIYCNETKFQILISIDMMFIFLPLLGLEFGMVVLTIMMAIFTVFVLITIFVAYQIRKANQNLMQEQDEISEFSAGIISVSEKETNVTKAIEDWVPHYDKYGMVLLKIFERYHDFEIPPQIQEPSSEVTRSFKSQMVKIFDNLRGLLADALSIDLANVVFDEYVLNVKNNEKQEQEQERKEEKEQKEQKEEKEEKEPKEYGPTKETIIYTGNYTWRQFIDDVYRHPKRNEILMGLWTLSQSNNNKDD